MMENHNHQVEYILEKTVSNILAYKSINQSIH